MTPRRLAAACALSLLLAGCGVFGTMRNHIPRTKRPGPEILDDGYSDHAGVIHIHTTYSDGAGTFEDVARAANQQHLDYRIVTDHNTLQPLRDGKQGWYGMTLVLVGTELSTPAGHYLAMGITEDISQHQPTQAIIDAVNTQGGLGFIAHPYFKKRRWTDWTVTGYTGMEAYNLVHDAYDENRWRLALWGVMTTPSQLYLSLVDRPYDPLSMWDRLLARHTKVVGIGSSDAHEFRLFGIKFAPYEILFQLVRTHILTTEPTLSPTVVYDALRRGHAYCSIDMVGDPTGFVFMTDDHTKPVAIMGDEVALRPDLQLTAVTPAPGEMSLFKDGVKIGTFTGTVWHVPVSEPGVYRLEVMRHGKPWIISNPMYLTRSDEPFGANAWP